MDRRTSIDWRANRLVDALAKSEARVRALPMACERLLDSAVPAVLHAAMLLGRVTVTFAANNHLIETKGHDGTICNKVVRDATPKPKCVKRKADTCLQQPARVKSACDAISHVAAWKDRGSHSVCILSASRLHNAHKRAFDKTCTLQRVDEIGSSIAAFRHAISGAAGLDELTRRVRARLSP